MAIQFDCPYCTATMRVPDSAMGTLGRCPKCETSLRVPTVLIPAGVSAAPRAAESTPVFAAVDPAAAETREMPRVTRSVAASPFPFAETDEEDRAATAEPSRMEAPFPAPEDDLPQAPAVLARPRRARPSRGWLWVSLAFGLAAIAIGGAYWWQRASNRVYLVEGRVLRDTSLSTVLAQDDYPLTQPDWLAIRKGLETAPAELRSSQMMITFASDPRGLKVGLKPGRSTELVAVPIESVPELQAAAGAAGQPLREPQRRAVTEALVEMSQQIQQSTAAGRPVELSAFGVSVGMTGLGGPLGYACHAVVDRNAYPCVFFDRDHRLYFLIPSGAGDFVIRRKETAGALGVLPERLQVRVSVRRGEPRQEASVFPSARKPVLAMAVRRDHRDADRSAGPDRSLEAEPPPAVRP